MEGHTVLYENNEHDPPDTVLGSGKDSDSSQVVKFYYHGTTACHPAEH